MVFKGMKMKMENEKWNEKGVYTVYYSFMKSVRYLRKVPANIRRTTETKEK